MCVTYFVTSLTLPGPQCAHTVNDVTALSGISWP